MLRTAPQKRMLDSQNKEPTTGRLLFRLHPVSTAPLTTALLRDRHYDFRPDYISCRSCSRFYELHPHVRLRANVYRRVCPHRSARVYEITLPSPPARQAHGRGQLSAHVQHHPRVPRAIHGRLRSNRAEKGARKQRSG
jgi:hypothetical protein